MTFRPRRLDHRRALAAITTAAVLGWTVAGAAGTGPATVTYRAVRGDQTQATDTLPPPPGCDRVMVVGDSLMVGTEPALSDLFERRQLDHVVDAQISRRITARVRAPYSGVRAVWALRQQVGESRCWVIGLGTNDLGYTQLDPAIVNAWIDEVLAAVTPGATVWWVNVDYRRQSGVSFDYPAASRFFNGVLADRADRDSQLAVVDWYTLAEANQHWFVDHVHVTSAGYRARAELIVAALP